MSLHLCGQLLLEWLAIDGVEHSGLTPEISQTQPQKIVYDKRLVATAHRIEVHRVLWPDEAHPGTQAVDGNNEEDSNDPKLLFRDSIVA